MNNRKKNRHLIVQMGVLCVVLFGVALVVNAGSILYNQRKLGIFLVNQSCQNVAGEVVSELEEYKALPWLLDYWEAQAETMEAGEERMLAALNEQPDVSPAELDEHVRSRVAVFTEGEEQFDDMTMLSLKITPGLTS